MPNDTPLIPLAVLYERISKDGSRYYAGALNNGAQLIMRPHLDPEAAIPRCALFTGTAEIHVI